MSAATTDGRNAIFMISEHEEQELIAVGRLTKERQLLVIVSRALDIVTGRGNGFNHAGLYGEAETIMMTISSRYRSCVA